MSRTKYDGTHGYRVWVNQPSTHQPFHSLHGKRGIAFPIDSTYLRVYFTEGPTISVIMNKNCIDKTGD